jgi:hypothetical protein
MSVRELVRNSSLACRSAYVKGLNRAKTVAFAPVRRYTPLWSTEECAEDESR